MHAPQRPLAPRRAAALAVALGLAAAAGRAAEPPPSVPAAPPCPTPPAPEAAAASGRGCAAAAPGSPAGPGGASGAARPGADHSTRPSDRLVPGPYLVRQTEHRASELISGSACDAARAFVVHFATRNVPFDARFAPSAAGPAGEWSYAYSIPRAGESHDARGSYTLDADAAAQVLHVTMAGLDHVVFKGFDGKMPVSYAFDLVAAPGAHCETAR